jgi:superfamily II DNA or RNA helicase
MATGLGKTVTFSRIDRPGRMLILSHREELVRQPLKYFDCRTGVEMAGERPLPGMRW